MNRREFVKLGSAFPTATVSACLTLKKEGQPPIEGLDVTVLRLHPGDAVVLSTSMSITMHEAERIKAYFESICPGTRAIVLGDSVNIEGVLRGPE